MKIDRARFSIPDCILDDDLPDKAFRLLVFLFHQSDISGRCAPGYEAIKEGACITSRTTISSAIKLLQKRGWFHFIKKGNGRHSTFFLRVPARYTGEEAMTKIVRIRAVQ